MLPITDLLRSLLVTTVSSKPYLLSPCLSFLSWLTKSSRGWVWNVDRNPVLRFILKHTFYKQFCAGESVSEARETLRQMKAFGFRGTILTHAKEIVFDQRTNKAHGQGVNVDNGDADRCESIAAWREGILGTVDLLGDGDQLALK